MVGEGRVPLPRTEHARRRFGDQETALIDVENDRETIDWLLDCCKPFCSENDWLDEFREPLDQVGYLEKTSLLTLPRILVPYSPKFSDGDQLNRVMTHRFRVEQAWADANDCLPPLTATLWDPRTRTEAMEDKAGHFRRDMFLKTARGDDYWYGENPTIQQCLEKMPNTRYCIRVELFHPD